MIVSAASVQDVAYLEQLGAAAVSLPTSEAHQALTTGTIDAVFADPSTIASFSLWEPARYITSNFPAITSAFFLLMNQDAYDSLSDEHRELLDSATGRELSLEGARAYVASSQRGLELAVRDGIEFITLSQAELDKINAAFAPVMEADRQRVYDNGMTGAEVIALMLGTQSQTIR
jgi:TRAP-type C4-dicarboxylate transport system substrate-binding protein